MSFSCPKHGYYHPTPGTTIAQCPMCAADQRAGRQTEMGAVVIYPPNEDRIRQIVREELERAMKGETP